MLLHPRDTLTSLRRVPPRLRLRTCILMLALAADQGDAGGARESVRWHGRPFPKSSHHEDAERTRRYHYVSGQVSCGTRPSVHLALFLLFIALWLFFRLSLALVCANAFSLGWSLTCGVSFGRWIGSFWTVQKEEEAEKNKDSRPQKTNLAPAAAKNAREAAIKARDEMELASKKAREAREAAQAARDVPPLYRKKHVMKIEEENNKTPSLLTVRLSQGKNFPLVGDSILNRETNVYAKLQVRNPLTDGEEFEPTTFYSTTQCRTSHPEFLQDFEFPILSDWEDETRPEVLEIIFLHQESSRGGRQYPRQDREFGRCRILLDEFVKLKPKRRYPDGTEEPMHFDGTITKWFKLHDAEDDPVRAFPK